MLTALDVPNLLCHVLGAKFVKRAPSATQVTVSSSMIIAFTSSAVRDTIISKKHEKGALRQRDVYEAGSDRNVYVNELLPKCTFDLLQQVKRIKRGRISLFGLRMAEYVLDAPM